MNKSYSFDKQQQDILDCLEQHQLVSAGAGSGKTTVMIQKITDLLLEGKVSANEILVVTFTNLASMEMRERLIKNLTETLTKTSDEQQKIYIQSILDGIETASVDTIDGFCSKMLKKYFYKSGLDPEIKIISSFSQEYYINKALELTINQFNKTNEKDLIVLCDIFEKTTRSLDNLKSNLLKAFNYCICQKNYDKFLDNILLQYKDLSSPSANYLNNHIYNTIYSNVSNIIRLIPDFTDFPKLHQMLDSYTSYLLNINSDNSLSKNTQILHSCIDCNFNLFKNIKDNISYEKVKYYVNNIRACIKETAFLKHLEENNLHNISSHLTSFVELLKLFIYTYDNLKKENGVMDFSDLERKMLEILQNKDIIEDFHSTYKYIFVDEYQDINPMQDQLINTLLAPASNLFIVGDVKQSIYGFRQSTPELFIKTYKDFKQDSTLGSAFDMKINFRSSPEILKFNNEIFSYLMTEKDADIDYAKTSAFEPRNTDFPLDTDVEIIVPNLDIKPEANLASGLYSVLNHTNSPQVNSPHDIEANVVLRKIKELIGTEVFDPKTKKNKIVEFKDIAILSRDINTSKINNLAKLLSENNIPINISKNTTLKENEGVNKILSLLKIINFTASDIDYTYLFTCPLVNITYDELLEIYTDRKLSLYQNLQNYISEFNNNLSIKIKYGFNLCEEFRIISSTMTVVELIESILNKYHLRQHLMTSPKGYEQLNILDEFIYSLSAEDRNLPISKFIDLIEKNISSTNSIISRDSLNSVTIQTIHASKGLEYPIVILFNCGKQFRYLSDYNDLNFDLDFGIGMQYYDLNERKRQESHTRYAIKLKNMEKAYKEELRLLYVATTRAKNKLIITGCCSEKKLRNQTLSKNCYINLILSTYYSKLNTNSLNSEYNFEHCKICLLDDIEQLTTIQTVNELALCEDNIINKTINFEYPYLNETNISIKNNVTALSRTLNEDYNIHPIKLNLTENLNATNDDLAQIGTLYHSALSSIDYSCPYLFNNEYDELDENLIKLAYDKISPIAQNCIKQSNEKQFMMYIPYKDIYPDSNIDTKILIQGVIDLILEFDDHIVLIDYKYSSSPIKVLNERYNTQLKLYKIALERAYHKPVTKSMIYSIKTGELG